MVFPDGRVVKNLPAKQEVQGTQVRPLSREDPLEEEMANPGQYSCLGNPMDRGAWWAPVRGVAKSQIQPSYRACMQVNSISLFCCMLVSSCSALPGSPWSQPSHGAPSSARYCNDSLSLGTEDQVF